ncbi:MAG: hypothetical protein HRU11_14000 [Parvularculaceae bacterium]|nr:hypothetical protein [Parvularculaceae bacterium]
MTEFEVALLVIQVLGAVLFGGVTWYGQRQIARIDALEGHKTETARQGTVEALAARVGALEGTQAVFDVRLKGAASVEQIREVIRQELDRALEPIKDEQDRMSRRLTRLEERTD